MQESIFTKIINGDIPSHKIYEDENVFAFLDIHPITEGHTLVIPKKQVEFVWDLEAPEYRALTDAAQKIAVHLRQVLNVPYVGQQIIGVDVPHAHIHLVPFAHAKDFHREPDATAEPDHAQLGSLAERIRLSES
jgi:histidine triad (HIT) family protein